MKKQTKDRIVAWTLCFATIAGVSACKAPGKSTSEAVTLESGETYQITDTPAYEMDSDWDFTSEDDHIAEVVGQNIVAYSPGVTTITANMGKTKKTYEVTVTEDEDARLLEGVQDVKNEYAYLGVGYNAFKQKGYITLSKTQTRAIINSEAIKTAIQQGMVKGDDSEVYKEIAIQGTSDEDYANDYQNQIEGALDLNIKGIVSGVAKGNYKKTNNSTTNTKTVYNTVMSYDQMQAYWLESNLQELSELTQMNDAVWRSLTGEDGTKPEEFFENYGTHVVTRVYLGGRMEMNYKLYTTSKDVTEAELLDLSGKINLNMGAVKGSAEAKYYSEELKNAKQNNMKTEVVTSVYGGKAPFISTLETFPQKHEQWRNSLNKQNLTFIGTDDAGLVPVWLLLDKTDPAQQERIEALKAAYAKNMNLDLQVVNDFEDRLTSEEVTEETATEETTAATEEQ